MSSRLRGRGRLGQLAVIVLAVVVSAVALWFGVWATVTRSSAVFGRLTGLAGVFSLVLAAVIASVSMVSWARSTRRNHVLAVDAGEASVPSRPEVLHQIHIGRDVYIASGDQTVNITDDLVQPNPVPGLLPRDVPGFTGREEELDRLTVIAKGASTTVTVIDGTAGVGKTALAIHAAHRLMPQFPDGQLYADLRGYSEGQVLAEPGEVLEGFLRRLGVTAEDMPAMIEERSGLLRHLLAPRRVLILLDNVGTEAQVRPLLPGAGSSLVIITSRDALAGLEVDQRIDLDVLSDNEATALLAMLIGSDRAATESYDLQQVRAWCGGLPLALWIVGQLLAVHRKWPVARLARLLSDERDRLDQLAVGDRQVRAAFMVSYRQLANDDARMFRLLGILPGRDFDAFAVASLAGVDLKTAEPMLERMVLAHLISEQDIGRYAMHDLLRLFAHQICHDNDDQATRDTALTRLVDYYAAQLLWLEVSAYPWLAPEATDALAKAHELPTPWQAVALFEAERPNLLAILALAHRYGWHEKVLQLSENMDRLLTLLRHFDDLLNVNQTALAAAQSVGDIAAQGGSFSSLGNAYQALGRSGEAIISYQEALRIFREIGDQKNEGVTLGNLGVAYSGLRRFDEAIPYYRDAQELARQTSDRNGEARALGNLGTEYQNLGRFDDAIRFYEDALDIFREIGDQHEEAHTLGNLCIVYQSLQRFEDAIACGENALTTALETGDDHYKGEIHNEIGSSYYELGQSEEAIPYYQDALEIAREIGAEDIEILSLRGLAVAYSELGRLEEAIPYYQDALAIFREIGDRHGETQALGSLGVAYSVLQRFSDAIPYYMEALEVARQTGEHHDEGMVLSNLGNAYQGLRRSDDAIASYRDAMEVLRRTGDRHQEGVALSNLGHTYYDLKDERAALCWDDAAKIMHEVGDHEMAAQLEEQAANARSSDAERAVTEDGLDAAAVSVVILEGKPLHPPPTNPGSPE